MWIWMAGKDREFLNATFCEYLSSLKHIVSLCLDVAQDCVARKASGNKGKHQVHAVTRTQGKLLDSSI